MYHCVKSHTGWVFLEMVIYHLRNQHRHHDHSFWHSLFSYMVSQTGFLIQPLVRQTPRAQDGVLPPYKVQYKSHTLCHTTIQCNTKCHKRATHCATQVPYTAIQSTIQSTIQVPYKCNIMRYNASISSIRIEYNPEKMQL